MNTLSLEKLTIYLVKKKSISATIILSIFALPFALIYTRGILGWLFSIGLLIISIIPISLISVAFGGIWWYDVPFLIGYGIVGIWYFIFAITDASRVNDNLLHELRFKTTMTLFNTIGEDND